MNQSQIVSIMMDATEREFLRLLIREAIEVINRACAREDYAQAHEAARLLERVRDYLLAGEIPFRDLAALHELKRMRSADRGWVGIADALEAIGAHT